MTDTPTWRPPYTGTHHNGGYASEAEWEEEMFGRGAGDVDHWGNPDEPEDLSPSKPLPMLAFMKEIEDN